MTTARASMASAPPAAPLAGFTPLSGPLRAPGPPLTEGLAAAAPALRTILVQVLRRRHRAKLRNPEPFARRTLAEALPAGRLEIDAPDDPAASGHWTFNPTWDRTLDPRAAHHRTALGFDLCAALALLDGIPPAAAVLAVLEAVSGLRLDAETTASVTAAMTAFYANSDRKVMWA